MSLPPLLLCLLSSPGLALARPVSPVSPAQDIEIPADTEIVTTESGLKYSVLRPGSGGARPGHGDRVRVHYTGWLENGRLIQSSRPTGRPIEIGVGQQKIKGLNEGLQLIEPGGHIKLTIPPELGYGEKGRGKHIPPNSTLIYEVELIEVTARVPDFLPLDEEASETLPSGLRMQWIEDGEGPLRGAKDQVWVDYTYWDVLGEPHFSTTMTPTPVLLAPSSLPFKFFEDAFQVMGEGDEALFEVPPELLFGDRQSGKLPPNSVTIWRVKIVRVFQKPTFPTTSPEEYTKLPAGLQYRIVKEGHGKQPMIEDRVRMHFTGWLTDGTEVATSYEKQRQPFSMQMKDLIPGMAHAMALSKEGGVIEVVIPGHLGYGEKGKAPLIRPNATLVYVAELIQVY